MLEGAQHAIPADATGETHLWLTSSSSGRRILLTATTTIMKVRLMDPVTNMEQSLSTTFLVCRQRSSWTSLMVQRFLPIESRIARPRKQFCIASKDQQVRGRPFPLSSGSPLCGRTQEPHAYSAFHVRVARHCTLWTRLGLSRAGMALEGFSMHR